LVSVAEKAAIFPFPTQRVHSVLDSHAPSAFFHDVFVAIEKAVYCDPLLFVLVSASPPTNPMSVSLLSVIAVLLFCPRVLGHFRQGPPLPRQTAAFLGGPEWGVT
jgi:hypothetical protein